MAVTTTPRADAPGPAAERVLSRFDRVERAVHWTNAALFLFLLATGYTLAGAPGTGWIGNRRSVVELHTYVGYALPFPVLLGIATHIGRQLREDLHRFSRWTADDSRWWRKSTRRSARIGKFNPGQKLNAVFIGACIIVMPATGTFLRWPAYFPHSFVDGADFTHRWFALAILLVTIGHIAMALSRPSSLRGMFTGKVPESWARQEHPRWHAEVTSKSDQVRHVPAGVEDRVDALLGRLSLREKLAQLGGAWITDLVDADAFSATRAERVLANGIGTVTRIGATTGLRPNARARLANAMQRHLVEQTAAGIPAIIHEESTAGFCARDATQFPQAIGLAATWDPELIGAMAHVIREQMIAVGARHTLAPVLDIARDPRWGRTEETYGESRHLTSRMGVAYVRGMQTGDLRGGVACTGKHFLGYGLSEGGMNHAPVHLGGRELREVFAEPFRAAIAEAGIATVMNSYASVDGLPCGGSYAILTGLLRDELGFDGVVVADYFTIGLLLGHHRIAPNLGRAAEVALRAGLDMELPNTVAYGDPLLILIERGEVDVALVDRSVRRVLALKVKLGLFEQPYVDDAIAVHVYDTPDQRALARELAAASIVVCTNAGVLPLDASVDGPVAVIGPCADDVRLLQGDYSYPAHAEIGFAADQPADRGILPSTVAEGTMAAGPYYPPSVTPLAALRELLSDVRYERGCAVDGDDRSGIAAAVEAARASRVAVVCVGGRSGLTPDSTTGEFRDATSLRLTGPQQELVDAVFGTGTPTVVVLVSGRVHALPHVAEGANALVVAWCPGEEGGHGLADVLCGHHDASGRLPITVPRSAGQIPIHHDHRAGGGRSMMLGDYADAPSAPLFPFGHGLSYTPFEYDRLKLSGRRLDDGIQVRCRVKNTGRRAGIETVQVYVRDDIASVARPDRELCAFAKVALEPGRSEVVELVIEPRQLAFYDEGMRFGAEPGSFTVMVGASAGDVRLEGTIKLGA